MTYPKWEYFVSEIDSDVTDSTDYLDEQGKDGWELVSVVEYQQYNHDWVRFYFKRPGSAEKP